MLQDIILFLVGIIVGAMNAIAGGGMLIGFPALIAAGLSPLSANVTGWFVILPGLIASTFSYRKYMHKLSRYYLLLLIPCAVGGIIGAFVLKSFTDQRFSQIVPGLIFFAIILFAVQPFLHFHLRRHIKRGSRNLRALFYIGLAILPIAAYGGFFGPGFGFLMLAFLSFTPYHEIHQMNGLKNLAGISICIAALLCLAGEHLVYWPFAISMGAGTLVGGYGGARYSQRVSSHILRIAVIAIGLCAAAYLALRAY
jgi:uncharacterized membrane protein YfcA